MHEPGDKPLALQLWEARNGEFGPWLIRELTTRSMGDVARELAISRSTLWRWRRAARVERRMESYLEGAAHGA